jgi:hypothetical protein
MILQELTKLKTDKSVANVMILLHNLLEGLDILNLKQFDYPPSKNLRHRPGFILVRGFDHKIFPKIFKLTSSSLNLVWKIITRVKISHTKVVLINSISQPLIILLRFDNILRQNHINF